MALLQESHIPDRRDLRMRIEKDCHLISVFVAHATRPRTGCRVEWSRCSPATSPSTIASAAPQTPASNVDSAEFSCKLLILPLFCPDDRFHPRGAGGSEW